MAKSIMTIAVMMVLPAFRDTERLRLIAAVDLMTSDIELAQVMSITAPSERVVVRFDGDDTYWLALASSPGTPMPRPDTGNPYLVEVKDHPVFNDTGDYILAVSPLGPAGSCLDCPLIFVDGFESGDLSAWSSSQP